MRRGKYHKQMKPAYLALRTMKSETKERKFIKRQLINSKGAVCAICGGKIANMKDCTIDHIIPVSKGGQTSLENCQLAHAMCNFNKGNKMGGTIDL